MVCDGADSGRIDRLFQGALWPCLPCWKMRWDCLLGRMALQDSLVSAWDEGRGVLVLIGQKDCLCSSCGDGAVQCQTHCHLEF